MSMFINMLPSASAATYECYMDLTESKKCPVFIDVVPYMVPHI